MSELLGRGRRTASGSKAAPPGRRRGGPGRLRRLLRRRWMRVSLALFGVFLAWFCWSMGRALAAPGDDSVAARVAEWGRDHHLGVVVAWLETAQYNLHPPKTGGTPSIALRPDGGTAPGTASAPSPHSAHSAAAVALPPRLVSPARPALPGEGAWQVLRTVHGRPAVIGAYLRPDATHTSYVAAVASMDPALVRFELHPGTADPGPANWGVPYSVPPASRSGLVATFNGGFKINQSGGGFLLGGVTKGALKPGAASLVFYRDGRVAVGTWGSEVSMSPQVVGVRQNLRLVVDHGRVPSGVNSDIESGWGLTIGGKYFVWRSGVGVTADGRVVFVYGPALSVRTLADLLQRAGCVEAMQLDINPAWMSFMYYRPPVGAADPVPVKLLAGQQRPADRYYTPTSRDFVAVFAR
ncbi:phosphodiester glycosidase family protein [Phaeacidiphilus oryzae]|uniref:phosphodiester glycosidase family protein n=1 Tax=Phaeacidiphilus oryzae TaxID=348818 RepID=UPI0005618AC0|nr:phosphodiester glycosidase family protein [Phaeacidiphilus oryzae]